MLGGVPISTRQTITRERFNDLTRHVVGLPVAHTWRGHGSAIFLELGALREPEAHGNNERGEASIMIEWSWRVETERAIRFGSWSGERRITNGVRALVGRTVTGLALEGRLPELVVSLSAGLWVRSCMTTEGQPEWTVFLLDGSWLCVDRGHVVHDTQNVRL